jgi:[protein-PII] uridylyltransferase
MECIALYSRKINELFKTLFISLREEYRYDSPCSLIAIGGYGRGEVCPYSDIDLQLLYKENSAQDFIGAFERAAWDSGFTLGFVARTPDECSRILGDDDATDTALLESSFIAGDFDLYTCYIEKTLRPHFHKNRRRFLDEMRTALLQGIDSTVDTLYRIEPDVKNGICCLRDCQRIGWAERVAQGVLGGQSRPDNHFIAPEDRSRLLTCYGFLIKVRIELHMLGKRRLDVLEIGLQKDIARSFGYAGGSPENLISDFFKNVTTVRQCILSFLENMHHERGMMVQLRSVFASFNAGNGLTCIDGVLYARKRSLQSENDAVWVLDLFTTAIACHADISIGLRNKVREAATRFSPGDFRNPSCEAKFLAILSAPSECGRVIQLMHETGILDLLVPEFAPLACRVEFDTYHEYTVDQHTLLALRAFDELRHDSDAFVQRIALRIHNRSVFRFALLLHDSGKAYGGDHCRDGAIIARNAAARVGFDEQGQQQVEFLVYHHLDMSELSLRRTVDTEALRQFADVVGSHEMLAMLYILTVLDIRHVSSRAMTGWKAVQLAELFSMTEKFFDDGSVDQPKGSSHYVFPDYSVATHPEELPSHEKWLAQLDGHELQLHTESFSGFYRVTVITHDRMALLADIAACFIAAGLQIISANVHSLESGKVIDIFDVEPEVTTVIPLHERTLRFRKTWEAIRNGKTTSRAVVRKKLTEYPVKTHRHIATGISVTVNNDEARAYTIIEVRAPDRFGLFYSIVNILGAQQVNITAARIATAVDIAVDVFFVTDATGAKIVDTERIAALQQVIVNELG